MARWTVVFEGDTDEEVIVEMERFLAARRAREVAAPRGKDSSWEAAGLSAVLDKLGGKHARKFLVRLAREVQDGKRLHNTAKLQQEFGVKGGIGFAGVIGPMNLKMKNSLGRKLVQGQWERDHASWTIDEEASQIILDKWG
jgi:hypothetical protein